MTNAFSQVVAILVSVFLFFGLPFLYTVERAETARQFYMLSQSIYLVDGICNTGILTEDIYERYCSLFSSADAIYELHLEHERKCIQRTEENELIVCSEYYDEKDIVKILETTGSYTFQKGDYLKILVQKTGHGFSDFFEPENQVVCYYGGMVKYEMDGFSSSL